MRNRPPLKLNKKPNSQPKFLLPIVWLIATQVIGALTLIQWLFVLPFVGMMFDAPGSTKIWQNWVGVCLYCAYPFWLIGWSACGWFYLRREKITMAIITTSLVVLPALLIGLFIWGKLVVDPPTPL